jgi:hypothetical protein
MALLFSDYLEADLSIKKELRCAMTQVRSNRSSDAATSGMTSLARADCTFLRREEFAYQLHVSLSLLKLTHMA